VFYDRLNELCNQAGLTITVFAEDYLHVSNAAPTAWRHGSSPKISVVAEAAKHFKVSSDYLLGLSDDPRPISAVTDTIISMADQQLLYALHSAPAPHRDLVYKMALTALGEGRGAAPAFVSLDGQDSAQAGAKIRPFPKRRQADERRVIKTVQGRAAAGPPITAVPEDDREIRVPVKYTGEQYFIVQAEGDSMLGLINDGDFCVFNKDGIYDDGRVVLVQVGGRTDEPDATIKRVYRRPGDKVELRSINPKYLPMIYPAEEVVIMGEFVTVLPHHPAGSANS